MIKAILFDLGNVLIDYRPEIFIQRLHQKTGLEIKRLVEFFLWSNLDRAYTEGRISSDEFFNTVVRELKFNCSKEEFQDCWNDIFTGKDEMLLLVQELKKSYPVWILSNTNQWHFEFLRSRFSVLNHIDQFFLSYEMNCQKPDDRIYTKVIQNTGFRPEEVFFTDDIEANTAGAKRAGFQTHVFTSVKELKQELKRLGICNGKK